jgi:hypothetical protein
MAQLRNRPRFSSAAAIAQLKVLNIKIENEEVGEVA